MTTLMATKLATEQIDSRMEFKIDFSKKQLTNSVLAMGSAHASLASWLRHPLLKQSLLDAWQQQAAEAINVLSNHKLNEKNIRAVLQETEKLAESLSQDKQSRYIKPLISSSWLLDLQKALLLQANLQEKPRALRDAGQSLSYLHRLSGIALLNDNTTPREIATQWRDFANSKAVMQCAAEYRALLLLYYLQVAHPFAQSQTAISFTMFYGLLKSAGFAHVADAIIVYYAENIETLASVFAATRNAAHLKYHQQLLFEFFLDAWAWATKQVQASVDKILLQSHYQACIQNLAASKQLNERQQSILIQLQANEQLRDKHSMQAAAWYRSLYKKLTTRTQERDFKLLCEQGLLEMLSKTEFKLTN